jgi:hypothetical protein
MAIRIKEDATRMRITRMKNARKPVRTSIGGVARATDWRNVSARDMDRITVVKIRTGRKYMIIGRNIRDIP